MKEYIIENKKNIIIIAILVILTIILSIIINHLGHKNIILKNDYISNLDVKQIELKQTACDFDSILKYSDVPHFNLNKPVFDKLNKEILEVFLLRACYQNGEIHYESSLNQNILSVAINISYESTHDFSFVEYQT